MRFTVLCLTILSLVAIAYAMPTFAPAQDTFDLAVKLTVAGFIGWCLSFLAGVYTERSGGSGDLAWALLFLILHVVVIGVCLVFAYHDSWSGYMAAHHARGQWTLMGLEALYLIFVTWD